MRTTRDHGGQPTAASADGGRGHRGASTSHSRGVSDDCCLDASVFVRLGRVVHVNIQKACVRQAMAGLQRSRGPIESLGGRLRRVRGGRSDCAGGWSGGGPLLNASRDHHLKQGPRKRPIVREVKELSRFGDRLFPAALSRNAAAAPYSI